MKLISRGHVFRFYADCNNCKKEITFEFVKGSRVKLQDRYHMFQTKYGLCPHGCGNWTGFYWANDRVTTTWGIE